MPSFKCELNFRFKCYSCLLHQIPGYSHHTISFLFLSFDDPHTHIYPISPTPFHTTFLRNSIKPPLLSSFRDIRSFTFSVACFLLVLRSTHFIHSIYQFVAIIIFASMIEFSSIVTTPKTIVWGIFRMLY